MGPDDDLKQAFSAHIPGRVLELQILLGASSYEHDQFPPDGFPLQATVWNILELFE